MQETIMKGKKIIEQRWKELNFNVLVENGRVHQMKPGHTRQVAYLPTCHSGVMTSQYYAAGIYMGLITEEEGVKLLEQLEELQIKDPVDPQYGGSRWYWEETSICDTNGAFFISMPLLEVYLFANDCIPNSNKAIMERLFSRSVHWFQGECVSPQIHYSNKILSDGAAFASLAYIMNDEDAKKKATEFCYQWERYTTQRGWGWGENISPGYTEIIADALLVIGQVVSHWDYQLAQKMSKQYHTIVNYARFHGTYTYVPAIRSYNFQGAVRNEKDGVLNLITYKMGIDNDLESRIETITELQSFCNCVIAYAIYEDKCKWDSASREAKIFKELFTVPDPAKDEVRIEHVFDEAQAYTWKGTHCRLGSINHYPVIPGCYQFPTWGLGWQSMPVAFVVKDAQMGFARFLVNDGELVRTHPAYDHHSAYLSPALFKETYLPAVRTNCSQNKNACIAIRTIENINNEVKMVADEWVIHNFHDQVERVDDWVCLLYPHCSVAILPLGGFDSNGMNLENRSCEVILGDQDRLSIKKSFYEGEKAVLSRNRLECGWVIITFDEIHELESLREELAQYVIEDEYGLDYIMPRVQTCLVRKVKLYRKEQLICQEEFDLYQGIRA